MLTSIFLIGGVTTMFNDGWAIPIKKELIKNEVMIITFLVFNTMA